VSAMMGRALRRARSNTKYPDMGRGLDAAAWPTATGDGPQPGGAASGPGLGRA